MHFFIPSDNRQYKRMHNKTGALKRKAHIPITLLKHFPKTGKSKEATHISRIQKPQLHLKLKVGGRFCLLPPYMPHFFPLPQSGHTLHMGKKIANGEKKKTTANLSDEIVIKKMPSENITWR